MRSALGASARRYRTGGGSGRSIPWHTAIEPVMLRFEEGGGSLPPDRSLRRKEYQGGSGSRSEIDASRGSLETPFPATHEVLPTARCSEDEPMTTWLHER